MVRFLLIMLLPLLLVAAEGVYEHLDEVYDFEANRNLNKLVKASIRREIARVPKRGYTYVQAGWSRSEVKR